MTEEEKRKQKDLKGFSKKLKESKEIFKYFAEQPLIGTAIMRDYKIVYVNQKACDIIGYSQEEIYKWKPYSFFKMIAPSDKQNILNYIEDQLKQPKEELGQSQMRLINKRGEMIWIEVFSKTFQYEDNLAFMGIFIEISKQKAAEKHLKDSVKKYRFLFENSPYSVLLMNKNGKILDVNPALEKLTGYPREDLIGKKFYKLKLLFPKDLPILFERFANIVGGTPQPPLEFQIERKDGKVIWINIESSMLQMEEETIVQVIGFEVSERKKAKQELIISKERYKDALKRVNFIEDLFAHDMKNILQSILSSVNLISILRNEPEKQMEVKEMLDILEEQSIRGANLISNVQILSELEEQDVILIVLNSTEILKGSIKKTIETFPRRKIKIKISSELEKIWIIADHFIEYLFDNILQNAVIHNTNPIVEIQIKVSEIKTESENYIRFQFIDNGVGIVEERKKSILDKVHNRSKSVKGGGLGLVLVSAILKRYDGKIAIKNRIKEVPSEGTNVEILIPIK